MKRWQKALILMVAIPTFIGSLLFMINQGVELHQNMGWSQSQDNIVHVDLSGNIISNTTHFIDNEQLNSSNQTLTLAHAPNPPSSLQLKWDGLYIANGSENDYILSGNSITLLVKKEPWEQFYASYRY
jgi:archaellum component FlaF (FlaF/FlaG flagellin family)